MNSITFSISPGDTQIIWDNTDGIIDKFYLHPLKVQAAGELTYIGTSLHDLAGKENTEDADYAIRLKIMGTDDLQLDLRTRRQDSSNFIALKINFTTDTISIVETIAGVETSLDSVSHDFKFAGRVKYVLELWTIGRFIYGFVNGFNIVQASTKSFRIEPGLSISFPTFNDSDAPIMYTISAIETENHPDPRPIPSGDPGGLFLSFRQSIKQQIENPLERTWETYVKAVKFYEQRNVGMPDDVWEELGYPIKKPSAEEWFGNLS